MSYPRVRDAKFRRLTPLSVEEWAEVARSLKDSSLALKQVAGIVSQAMGSTSADGLDRFGRHLSDLRGRLEKFALAQHPEWAECSTIFLSDQPFEQGPRISARGKDEAMPLDDWLEVGRLFNPILGALMSVVEAVGPAVGVKESDRISRLIDMKYRPVRSELEIKAIDQQREHQAEISRLFGDRPIDVSGEHLS